MLVLHVFDRPTNKAPCEGVAIRPKKDEKGKWIFTSWMIREGQTINRGTVLFQASDWEKDLEEFRLKQWAMLRLENPRTWWTYLEEAVVTRH